MSTKNLVRQRYSRMAIGLHWLMAVGLTVVFGIGYTVSHMALSPLKLRWVVWHKWIGITLLGLAVLRLLWRATHRPPPLPGQPSRWVALGSAAVHGALYILMLAIPVVGLLHSSAAGVAVVYFNWFKIPELIHKNRELAHLLKVSHEYLNWGLAALVGLHGAAALKHQWWDRDHLLDRMRWRSS